MRACCPANLERVKKLIFPLVGKSVQLLLTQLGKRIPEGKKDDDDDDNSNNSSTSPKRDFFFLKQWFRRHQRPLLQARLHQSGVTEMLMVREIRKSFIIGNHILCVPEGIIP